MATKPAWLITGRDNGPPPVRARTAEPPHMQDDVMRQIVVACAKLSLKNSLEVRELQAAIFTAVLLPRDSDIVAAGNSGTKGHHDKAAELRSQGKTVELDRLGAPCLHCWGNMIVACASSAKASKEDKQILEEHLKTLGNHILQLESKVYICKVKRCYDKRQQKAHMAVHPDVQNVLEAMVRVMQAEGGKVKRGTPPKAGLERELQSLLDNLTEVSK
eukprot:TRINITY_DN3860_c3_g1_i6.p1 TRINITY_DN3860_c3_g1~~TRINITY_DN3860_c3_g1_i6.p1  ORF type:complete len:236 (-),score=63.13 TRINITY_DN3860_c3_g1_i6:337-987(-)